MAISEERGSLLLFDSRLRLVSELSAPFPLRDIHQIASDGTNLLVSCSLDNMIAIYDGVNWNQWFPLGESSSPGVDVNHFNSFLLVDDRILILAHNWGPTEVLEFSSSERKLLKRYRLGNCAHDLWVEGNELLTCSSADGWILGSMGTKIVTQGFPRGVGLLPGVRLVGISTPAPRSARDLSSPWILRYSSSWSPDGYYVLPNQGLILDILPCPIGTVPFNLDKFHLEDRLSVCEYQEVMGVPDEANNETDKENHLPVDLDVIDFPERGDAGTILTGTVIVHNRSLAELSSWGEFPIYLASHTFHSDGRTAVFDGKRCSMSTPVSPGQSLEVQIQVELPAVPGDYLVQFDLVREGRYWFNCPWPRMFLIVLPN